MQTLPAKPRSWERKDNRVEQFTCEEDVVVNVQLQASGKEPMMIDNTGSAVTLGYNRGGPYFTIPDGYQYTWERQNPFGSELWLLNTTAVTTVVTFLIGGSSNVR